MTKVVCKSFTTKISGFALDNDYWKVTVKLTENFIHDDETEKEEIIESMCIDSDFVQAQQVAMSSALLQYREEVYDKGMHSLIESREKFGKPNDNSIHNQDTVTQ